MDDHFTSIDAMAMIWMGKVALTAEPWLPKLFWRAKIFWRRLLGWLVDKQKRQIRLQDTSSCSDCRPMFKFILVAPEIHHRIVPTIELKNEEEIEEKIEENVNQTGQKWFG